MWFILFMCFVTYYYAVTLKNAPVKRVTSRWVGVLAWHAYNCLIIGASTCRSDGVRSDYEKQLAM